MATQIFQVNSRVVMDIIAWLQNWVDSLFKKDYFNDSYEYDEIDIMGNNNI